VSGVPQNPKVQTPNPKEIPIGKSKNPKETRRRFLFFPLWRFGSLDFPWDLELGIWDFSLMRVKTGCMTRIVFALPAP
jgi:hypothetical protein